GSGISTIDGHEHEFVKHSISVDRFSGSVNIREGMKFVQEAVLKNSGGSGCRKDGKRVTISAVGMLKPAGAYRKCSWIAIWSDSPYLRMSTGAKHLHGDRPAYLSACKRLTRFRPPAQPKK